MSELQLLFLILAVIYLWECTCWLGRGSVAFFVWWGRTWHPVHPGSLLGNQRGGLALAWPLPPLGSLVVGNQFPLSISPEAVLAFVAFSVNPGGRPAQTGKLVRFEDIRSLSVKGKKVIVNGELLLKATSGMFATEVARTLQRLGKLSLKERARAIEEMTRESFDTRLIKNRWEDLQKQMIRVRLLTNCFFVYLFVGAPTVIWRFGLGLSWPGLVVGLLAFTTATAVSFWRVHKAFYPTAEDERFTHFLTILLSPATTSRACDVLMRPLLEPFHPLAVAKVFCADKTFRALSAKMLRDIRHPALPLIPDDSAAAQAVERDSRMRLQKNAEDFLRRTGIKPEELLGAPPRSEENCISYCPRCLAQFTTRDGQCNDCGGLALVGFPASR